MISPVTALQSAVDIVQTSPHETNKIAATIFHETNGWSLSRTNYWPKIIKDKIGRETKIGNSSGTLHAETACIFAAAFEENRATAGASIAITDPPCPNCVKNMAEAGIDNIYIDHKGFQKDFAKRRIEYFNKLSVRLGEKAGISIYEVNRKTGNIVPITIADKDYMPFDEQPLIMIRNESDFKDLNVSDTHKSARAVCVNSNGDKVQLTSISHPALGFRSDADQHEITHPETKYSYQQEACNRLLMNIARRGLNIHDAAISCSEIPTSREFVNMIGAGIQTLSIKNPDKARDEHALQALKQITDKKLLNIQS